MRTLKRNRQSFWYAKYLRTDKIIGPDGKYSGQDEVVYSVPQKLYAPMSAAAGEAESELFGINVLYDRTLVIENKNALFNENDILWIGIDPQIENGKATVPHNYIVTRVSPGLDFTGYALVKVDVNA